MTSSSHINAKYSFEFYSSSSSSSSSSSEEDEYATSRNHRKRVNRVLNILPSVYAVLSRPNRRRYFERNRERSHQQIWNDYFDDNSTYPIEYFRRRYRMRKELFLRILKDIETEDDYFVQKKNCTGRWGLSSLQKMTAAVRILAYGASADQCDEYVKIGESTAIESLKRFCNAVISLYKEQYMRSPNEQDITRLLQEGKDRGFPGMLGSIDCMHWEWKNCPTAWHGTHKGHHHKPTLILEAVASKDLWIWHAFFGMSGSHNDLNVLDHSPVFDTFIYGNMPNINFEVNKRPYTLGYYLCDGIYPKWATLMQTIAHPTTPKESLFARKQEAVRKDIERAFGVLQIRWGITKGAVRFWKKSDLCVIMKACIILHNMIVEDERDLDVEEWRPPPDETGSLPEYIQNQALRNANISSRLGKVCNKETNAMLRLDLMENLWNKFGDEVIM